MIIAIDGPAGAGKGTLARKIADYFSIDYLDTGVLYRACAYFVLAHGVDTSDPDAVIGVIEHENLRAVSPNKLRTQEVGRTASLVAALPEVRRFLFDLQRDFAKRPGGAVLDGRDIGTVICPDADVKLFVTASTQIRAERRAGELRAAGETVDIAELARDLAIRDKRDAERSDAPLKPADDAILLDTSELSIDEAFERAREIIKARVEAQT
jgi:CMP/dCMP kinase